MQARSKCERNKKKEGSSKFVAQKCLCCAISLYLCTPKRKVGYGIIAMVKRFIHDD